MTLKKHFLLSLAISINSLCSTEIVMNSPSGKIYSVRVDPYDLMVDVERMVVEFDSLPPEVQEEMKSDVITEIWKDTMAAKGEAEARQIREYLAEAGAAERADIAYIVNTLADTFEPKLFFYQTELQAAGARIAHVHPLNFLGTIFRDEVLKVKIRMVKKKSIAWKNFVNGVSTTMQEELGRNNLTREMMQDFAERVGVNPNFFYPFLKTQLWEQMVICLMNQLSYDDDYGF